MTDLRFIIPNQTRRNYAASRLKREGYDVRAEPTKWDAKSHPLDVLNVDDGVEDVERLVEQIAPGAVRAL